jgi:hypothetical protein
MYIFTYIYTYHIGVFGIKIQRVFSIPLKDLVSGQVVGMYICIYVFTFTFMSVSTYIEMSSCMYFLYSPMYMYIHEFI